MDLGEQFLSICKDFPAFREALTASRELAHEPQLRDQLDGFCRELDRAFAEFRKEFPDGLTALQSDLAAARRDIEEARRTIAQADEQIRAAEQALAEHRPPAAAAPAPAPPEPEYSPRLREEIIARYFTSPQAPGTRLEGEVADMETRDW